MEETNENLLRLRKEAASLKLRLLEIKKRRQELKNKEKKKKMKESTPPPLKERKEIRKEDCLNNYNNNKGNFQKSEKVNSQETAFLPPTLDEVQTYMDEIGERRFTAVKFWNYYEAKGWVLGKVQMRFWRRVLDNWVIKENDRAGRCKKAKASTQPGIVPFNPYKPIDNTGAVSLLEYEQMKREGKI